MIYYKWLNEDLTPCNGGTGVWSTDWMQCISYIEPCISGYHICRKQDLVHWIGPSLWEVEVRGHFVACADKMVASQARLVRRVEDWNEKTARLFACDCAEAVLPLCEESSDSLAPHLAIHVAREYAHGRADEGDLAAAAAAVWTVRDAAAGAAAAAAWAARAAVRAAAADAAADAAAGAAAAAAWAWDTARDAARAATNQQQNELLLWYLDIS